MKLELILREELKEVTTCAYCTESLTHRDEKVVRGTDCNGTQTYLHEGCVVAFATKILNEWDRISTVAQIASEG